jgi:DNA-binding GntR family transcriptional regulator
MGASPKGEQAERVCCSGVQQSDTLEHGLGPDGMSSHGQSIAAAMLERQRQGGSVVADETVIPTELVVTSRAARPRRLRVAEEVAAILAEQILAGDILRGARLTETSTAAEMGVSRNTLREAFRILAAQGLVKIERQRGVRVSLLDREDIREMFALRRALELRAIEESPAAPPERMARLRHAVEQIERADAEGASWFHKTKADQEFHQSVVGLMDSRLLDDVYSNIGAMSRLLMLVAYQVAPNVTFIDGLSWVDEHRVIYELLIEGRSAEAKAQMERLLRENEANGLAYVTADPEASDHLSQPRSPDADPVGIIDTAES